jgi:acetyl-CoA carboxylase carboxyltransferase component
VIGIFNSTGADIFCGASSLAAYGKIIKAVNDAAGVIPQFAYVAGKCLGTAATIAAMFDFVVKKEGADFYVSAPQLTGANNAQADKVSYVGDAAQCAGFLRSLIAFLPENAAVGSDVGECADNLNRMVGDLDFGGDALSLIATVADNGVYYEISRDYAPELSTVFTTFGGVKCGVVANSFAKNEGRISAEAARKISKFVNFCNSFSLPVVTLVDSIGLAIDKDNEAALFSSELAKLGFAYAGATVPVVTVITGHAIGAAFVLLGSKSLGADIVYAIDNSEIGALTAEAGVAFAWDKYITENNTREDLILDWKSNVASPAHAAESGDIDDIIGTNEFRLRICSALLMLSAKGSASVNGRKILPL